MRGWAVVVALLLATPLASATAQDDAGSGGDAPGDGEPALRLVPGKYAGFLHLAEGDGQDWYQLDDEPGEAFVLTVKSSAFQRGPRLAVYFDHETRVLEEVLGPHEVTFRLRLPDPTTVVTFVFHGTQREFGSYYSYEFSPSFGDAEFEDDAGTGGDAPYFPPAPIGPGSHEGALHPLAADRWDRFRLEHEGEAGDLLMVAVSAEGGVVFQVLFDGQEAARRDLYDPAERILAVVVPAATTEIVLSFWTPWAFPTPNFHPRFYEFTVAVQEPADLAVHDLVATPAPLVAGAPTMAYDIDFDLANEGEGPTFRGSVEAILVSGTGNRSLFVMPVALAAGEGAHVRYRYDGAGAAGDMRLAIVARQPFQLDTSDDRAEVAVPILVAGTGASADPLNGKTWAEVLEEGARASWHTNSTRAGADAHAFLLEHDARAHAAVGAMDPFAEASECATGVVCASATADPTRPEGAEPVNATAAPPDEPLVLVSVGPEGISIDCTRSRVVCSEPIAAHAGASGTSAGDRVGAGFATGLIAFHHSSTATPEGATHHVDARYTLWGAHHDAAASSEGASASGCLGTPAFGPCPSAAVEPFQLSFSNCGPFVGSSCATLDISPEGNANASACTNLGQVSTCDSLALPSGEGSSSSCANGLFVWACPAAGTSANGTEVAACSNGPQGFRCFSHAT